VSVVAHSAVMLAGIAACAMCYLIGWVLCWVPLRTLLFIGVGVLFAHGHPRVKDLVESANRIVMKSPPLVRPAGDACPDTIPIRTFVCIKPFKSKSGAMSPGDICTSSDTIDASAETLNVALSNGATLSVPCECLRQQLESAPETNLNNLPFTVHMARNLLTHAPDDVELEHRYIAHLQWRGTTRPSSTLSPSPQPARRESAS